MTDKNRLLMRAAQKRIAAPIVLLSRDREKVRTNRFETRRTQAKGLLRMAASRKSPALAYTGLAPGQTEVCPTRAGQMAYSTKFVVGPDDFDY